MLQAGRIIQNTYKVEKLIGMGGSGRVYACSSAGNEDDLSKSYNKNNGTDRSEYRWAIKEAYEEENSGSAHLSIRALSAQALQLEVELLKNLNHPSLVNVIDVIHEDQSLFMVMEYVVGRPLDQVIRRGGAMTEKEVIDIGLQLADVLGYLHSRGQAVIYRDLKPSNLILQDDGRVVLVDFGTVFTSSKDFPIMKNAFGTRGYAAPEQYSQQVIPDARMDVYAFGKTLTALLTGGSTSLSKLKNISPEFLRILKRCTRRDPQKRYANISQVYDELKHIEEKSLRHITGVCLKLGLFISVIIPALVLGTDVLAGLQYAMIPAIVFAIVAVSMFLLFNIPELLFTLSGVQAKQRVRIRKKSARLNGTFQINEHSGICQAVSWDDIEIPLDETFMDVRIDVDSGKVHFTGMDSFVLEQDEVFTGKESYKALL